LEQLIQFLLRNIEEEAQCYRSLYHVLGRGTGTNRGSNVSGNSNTLLKLNLVMAFEQERGMRPSLAAHTTVELTITRLIE
jgi:hypothetical protein